MTDEEKLNDINDEPNIYDGELISCYSTREGEVAIDFPGCAVYFDEEDVEEIMNELCEMIQAFREITEPEINICNN